MKQIKKLAQTGHTLYAIFAVQQNHSKMAATLHLKNSKELLSEIFILK